MVLYTVQMNPYFQEKNKLENKMCDWVSLIDLSVSLPSHFQKSRMGYLILHHFLALKASHFKFYVDSFNNVLNIYGPVLSCLIFNSYINNLSFLSLWLDLKQFWEIPAIKAC